MKRPILLFFILLFAFGAMAQRYISKNGYIRFYSETPIETIEAHNRQVNAALDLSSGAFVFKVLLKSFEFEKALMQEHFNESYVESDIYPNATFQGAILNIDQFDISQESSMDAEIEGDLTIHGITQKVLVEGKLIMKEDDVIMGESVFIVKPADYDIKIPMAVVNNISEEIQVTVEVKLKKLN